MVYGHVIWPKYVETFLLLIRNLIALFSKNEDKIYTDKSEIINEYIPQDEIKNLIQEDLPFIKSEKTSENKFKFKLPNIDLLKIPTKKESEKCNNN